MESDWTTVRCVLLCGAKIAYTTKIITMVIRMTDADGDRMKRRTQQTFAVLEKGKTMKAWTVRGIDSDYATVVFAETVGKAKAIAVGTDACEDYRYIDIRAYRFKKMDKYYRGRREMDWYNDEDRTALVKAGWHCLDPYEWECRACCARELCEWRENDD